MPTPQFAPKRADDGDIKVVRLNVSEPHDLCATFVNGFGPEHILYTLNYLERSYGSAFVWNLDKLEQALQADAETDN